MTKFHDITLFFSPKCCNTQTTVNGQGESSCQSPAQKWTFVLKHFENLPLKCLVAGTITIGVKRYGKLDYKGQISEIKKAVLGLFSFANQQYKSEGKDDPWTLLNESNKLKYFVVYEFTQQGVIHAHLLFDNRIPQGLWNSHMQKFGSRNVTDKAYEPVADLQNYFKYMLKNEDNLHMYWHTNIKRSNM